MSANLSPAPPSMRGRNVKTVGNTIIRSTGSTMSGVISARLRLTTRRSLRTIAPMMRVFMAWSRLASTLRLEREVCVRERRLVRFETEQGDAGADQPRGEHRHAVARNAADTKHALPLGRHCQAVERRDERHCGLMLRGLDLERYLESRGPAAGVHRTTVRPRCRAMSRTVL